MKKFTLLAGLLLAGAGCFTASAQDEGEPNYVPLYLAGNFNNYLNTEDEAEFAQWEVTFDKEYWLGTDQYMFRRKFENLPSGELIFNLKTAFGSIIPAEEPEPGDEPTACEQNLDITLDDGFFRGYLNVGPSNIMWVMSDFSGGNLEVTIDMYDMMIILDTAETTGEENGVFISGSFNNYDPAGAPNWALVADEEAEGVYKKTFEIDAADEIKFNFVMMGQSWVPADNGEASAADVTIDDIDGGVYDMALSETTNTCWVIENWPGGDLEIVFSVPDKQITISSTPELADMWYIRCAGNDYNPAGNYAYALIADPEEIGVYSGTFNIAAGEFSFNLLSPQAQVFVPVDENELGTEATVEFENGIYMTSLFWSAYDETEEACYWVNDTWEGGVIKVTIDLNERVLFIEDVVARSLPVSLSGAFNENSTDPDEEWYLDVIALEGEVFYRGTFEIPEGEFKFNFNYGSFKLVPGQEPAEAGAEPEPVEADENVVFEDGYYGGCLALSMAHLYWVNEDWAGGMVEITVDPTNYFVNFSLVEPVVDTYYLSGEFNDYNPLASEPASEWALEETEENVYYGTFEIPAGEFSFNIVGATSVFVCPAGGEDVEVEFNLPEDQFVGGEYVGEVYLVYDELENYYWTKEDWAGGTLSVTLDLNTKEITIALGDTSMVYGINAANGEEVIYNLHGVRVNPENAVKGIYIVNGKKVVRL